VIGHTGGVRADGDNGCYDYYKDKVRLKSYMDEVRLHTEAAPATDHHSQKNRARDWSCGVGDIRAVTLLIHKTANVSE
jgi:hypothetical protein